ncbi:MAG: TrmH family RNA methyltransferase, partial [Gemmatimonadota bacterium]
ESIETGIRRMERTLERLGERGAEVREVDAGTLEEFADTVTPQGVLAAARIPAREPEELPDGGLLVLDAVQDPGNLGTLLRTAEAMGLAGVISLPGTVDPWNPKALRAAAGSTFRVPVFDADWEEARDRLRERDVEVWAADPLGEPVYGGGAAPERLALVLGNEGSGVSRAVLEDAHRRVRVPTAGSVESLNVAVAGALLVDRIFGLRAAAGTGA